MEGISIEKPIYISGLPRSGTTMLLEIIASHPAIATHRYRDLWSIYTPYWSRGRRDATRMKAVERSHGDGLFVTPNSPEAMEEVLWMTFFADLHDWRTSNVLDKRTENKPFESFYNSHLKKLLLARGARRYAAKANYNLSRIQYLLKLFPAARFVVPLRHPRQHVASLRKQQRIFLEAARRHPRSVPYLNLVGHLEFGVNRRPINMGDEACVRSIVKLWRDGQEVRGWARLWAHAYGALRQQLDEHPEMRAAVLIVPYEDLCALPESTLTTLCKHVQIDEPASMIAKWGPRLHAPSYYQPTYDAAEEAAIREETEDVARLFGYSQSPTEGPRNLLGSERMSLSARD